MLSSPVARTPLEKPGPDVDDTGEPVPDLSSCVEKYNSQEVPKSETSRMRDEEQGPDSKALEKNDERLKQTSEAGDEANRGRRRDQEMWSDQEDDAEGCELWLKNKKTNLKTVRDESEVCHEVATVIEEDPAVKIFNTPINPHIPCERSDIDVGDVGHIGTPSHDPPEHVESSVVKMFRAFFALQAVTDPQMEIINDFADNLDELAQSTYEPKGTTYEHPEVMIYYEKVFGAGRLEALASQMDSRYKETGAISDLQQAILYSKEALETIPQDSTDRTVYLIKLASRLSSRYEQTGTLEDLQQAISYGKEALAAVPQDDPNRAVYLSSLATQLSTRHERTGAIDDLQQAISAGSQALEVTPLDHPNRATYLSSLASSLCLKYERTGATEDLQQAILYEKGAMAATPQDHSFSNLAIKLSLRYERTGAVDDLQTAISYAKEALATTSQDDPCRAGRLNNLAIMLNLRYERTGAMDDFRQGISYAEEALRAKQQDDPSRVECLNNLANRLSSRYEQTRAIDDLQQSILYGEEALAVSGHLSRTMYLNNQATRLSSRYARTGAVDDLQQAILYSKEALAATPQDHPDRAGRSNNLSDQLSLRFRRTGALEDLEQAILYGKDALTVTPKDHPSLAGRLNSLAERLSSRHMRTGSMNDLQQAILHSEEALVATPQNHPRRADRLHTLASHLGMRYNLVGAIDDLHQAILYGERTLVATPQGSPHRAIHLVTQSTLLGLRYDRTEAMDDLQYAISYGEEALAIIPQDHPDRVRCFDNLARELNSKYRRTGVMDDLQKAILYSEKALAETPQDHPNRAGFFNSLAGQLIIKYEQTGAMDDLQQAISYYEEALAATPQDHPNRAGSLNRLAFVLSRRFQLVSSAEDISRSISYLRESWGCIASPPSDRILVASSFSYASYAFRISEKISSLERLTQRSKELCSILENRLKISESNLLLQSYITRSRELHSRLQQLSQRSEELSFLLQDPTSNLTEPSSLLGELDSFKKESISLVNESNSFIKESKSLRLMSISDLRVPNNFQRPNFHSEELISPLEELNFLRKQASNLTTLNTFLEESSTLLEGAILLLPKVSPRSLERQDQQYNLLRSNGLATLAASSVLEAGRTAYDALKLLELGRGIIMGFAIDCRSDLSNLEEMHPELFNKFNALRIEIDTPLPDGGDKLIGISPSHGSGELTNTPFTEPSLLQWTETYRQLRQRREQAIIEIEEIIAEIRRLPGQEEFQLPPSPKNLMSIARDGPIVIFISTFARSDAIIVTASAISSIPLPRLRYSEVSDQLGEITKLSKGTLRTYASRNKRMRELLFWLWDVAVRPVIEELQLTPGPTNDADLAHIWWIGTGELSTAPFHAAGDYSSNSDPHQNTPSYAISSYTPTIKALSHAREKDLTIIDANKADPSKSERNKPSAQLLLVTMPKTPGERDLPDVDEEVTKIVDVTKGLVLTEHLERPSAKDIIDRLQLGSCHAIHFACHGISDEKDPSNSHLILLKGSADGANTADKLTVQDISRRNTKAAQLAYLSACSTADNPEIRLADEMIHIASGFQLAGFNHVLATMWSSESKVCKEISADFYGSLFNNLSSNSGSSEGHKKVRVAFHKAIKSAQEKYRRSPLKWAPFIHMGA